ncbi:MAG: DUF4040 domain-containing protein [Rickettsiales bacterium]
MTEWTSRLNEWAIASDYLVIDWMALTLLIITAFLAIWLRNLLAAAVVLGTFSLLMALLYLLLDAPDVALTEAAVGAGISTVLFLATLSYTSAESKLQPPEWRIAPLMVVIVVGIALIYATEGLPPFASADAPIHNHVAPYYIEHMREDIAIPNLVTAILASYRGFDTMGEVGVIFTAGIAITALLMNLPAKKAANKTKAKKKEGKA